MTLMKCLRKITTTIDDKPELAVVSRITTIYVRALFQLISEWPVKDRFRSLYFTNCDLRDKSIIHQLTDLCDPSGQQGGTSVFTRAQNATFKSFMMEIRKLSRKSMDTHHFDGDDLIASCLLKLHQFLFNSV